MSEDKVESAKFYTLARRIPTVVGRLADGTKIPGGPYTITQAVLGLITALVLWKTAFIWGSFGGLGNLLVGAAFSYAIVLIAARIPTGGRNPFSWVLAVFEASMQPRGGTQLGRRIQVRRPHRVRHKVLIAPCCEAMTRPSKRK